MGALIVPEQRVTNAQTGGAKGSKPVMLDLVPVWLHWPVHKAQAPSKQMVGQALLNHLRGFWGSPDSDWEVDDEHELRDARNLLLKVLDQDLGGFWPRMWELSHIYGQGAEKYDPHNWRRGYDWSLSYRACARHLMAYLKGEERDGESGLHHVGHALFHVAALETFRRTHPELDDRP